MGSYRFAGKEYETESEAYRVHDDLVVKVSRLNDEWTWAVIRLGTAMCGYIDGKRLGGTVLSKDRALHDGFEAAFAGLDKLQSYRAKVDG